MRTTILVLIALLAEPVYAGEILWNTADRLNRRTCPSTDCGVVGRLFHREKVTVLERVGEWVRITQPYNASCQGGRSQFVDEGNSACVSENGIRDGKFAEWVSANYLSAARPPDPSAGATGDLALVKDSDDYSKYSQIFAKAARNLIRSGQCSEADFKNNGGWVKSYTKRSQPIYFMYCGRAHVNNRIYLDASSGRTFR